jgi:aspartokinase/homoserine dehydrogenase 1
VHSAFWLSALNLNIGIVGTGRVGSEVVMAILEQLDLLGVRFGLKIAIRGIANSRKMLLDEDLGPSFFSQQGEN